jgi:hypothetical protein
MRVDYCSAKESLTLSCSTTSNGVLHEATEESTGAGSVSATVAGIEGASSVGTGREEVRSDEGGDDGGAEESAEVACA